MSDESETVRVQLARMEGKLDLSNLRHDQHEAKFTVIDGRLNSHGDRIGGLEGRERERVGERKGLALTGKLMWGAVGLIPGGAIVGLILKAIQ